MSITNDAIKYLRDNGIRVVDRRGKALGGNNHNRSLSGLRRGGFHWDGVSGGTIEGHERHWRNTNGWRDGGYTAFIDDAGTVFMNYDFEKRTNGVGNHNTPTLNVCYAGTYSNPMNDKQRRAAKIFWTFVVNDKRTNINSFNDIWGHNEFPGHSSNSCPGVDMNVFRNYLKDEKVKPASNPEPKPSPQVVGSVSGAKLVKYENSTFTANTAIKVRNAPSTKATHTGTLKKGDRINYNAVYEGNGYRWLRYTGGSGATLFVPYRPSNDVNNQWGTFGNTTAKPKPQTTSVAGAKLVKHESANFTTNTAIKVRNAPSTKATHTGTLPSGATIRYDRVYEGNGYRWLSYIGGSGNRLYLPYRPLNNKNSWGRFH